MTWQHQLAPHYSTNVRANGVGGRLLHAALSLLGYTMPPLAQYLIKLLFFRPVRYRSSPYEQFLLEQAEAFTISVHGKKINCWKWGQGPGVLFAHGWNGSGIQFHLFFDQLIAAGYSVIVLDAPGHGQSQGTTSSYFEYTDTLRAFLKTEHAVDIKAVIAHSFGASAVINTLSKDKHSLEAVLLAPALELKELLWTTFDRYGIPRRLYKKSIADYERRFGYSLSHDNPHRLLQDIETRLLIIHDQDDQATPYQDSYRAAQEYNHVELITTKGLGHKKLLADKQVITVVTEYLISGTDQKMEDQATKQLLVK